MVYILQAMVYFFLCVQELTPLLHPLNRIITWVHTFVLKWDVQ